MARMIPGILSPETESKAEGIVFNQLSKQLDNTYTIFHSFGILSRNLQDTYIDKEIDFLIASPEKGVMALEVKGGSIRFDGTSGRWYQNNRPMKMSPAIAHTAAKMIQAGHKPMCGVSGRSGGGNSAYAK